MELLQTADYQRVMDKLKPQIALLFLDSEDEPIFG
jgi:hypothetical protein